MTPGVTVPFYLFLGERGGLGGRLWGAGDAVGLLVPHGNDGRGVHHGQVGGQAPLQAAADVLRGDRVSQGHPGLARATVPTSTGPGRNPCRESGRDTATIEFHFSVISSCFINLQLAGLMLPELKR